MKHMLIAAPALALVFVGCSAQKDANTASHAAHQAQGSANQAQGSASQAELSAQQAADSARMAQEARVQTMASQLGATERQGEGGNEWVIASGLLFQTNSAELSPDAKSKLDQVARALKSSPQKATEVHIQGFTDDRGTDQLNAALSERRAQAVADYLESRGISKAQVTTKGMGSANPVGNEQTAEGRAQNRRAEIIIRPQVPQTGPQ